MGLCRYAFLESEARCEILCIHFTLELMYVQICVSVDEVRVHCAGSVPKATYKDTVPVCYLNLKNNQTIQELQFFHVVLYCITTKLR